MISNLIVGIHDVYLSSDRRLLNTISYVHSYSGDNILGGERNMLYLCDYEKNGMGVS
jgi:hypothetical protein